ncbi:MAG: nuclear transport factor 2 family protein [Gemmatimonadota bacterium]
MRSLVGAASMLFALTTAVSAQKPGEADVRRAALDYIEGFYEGDSTRLVRSVHPDVQKFGFWIPRDSSSYTGGAMPWGEFLSYTRRIRERGTPAPPTAPREVVVYDILDQTASVRVTAFWGTDYLLLAKHNGRWMIRMVLWQTPQPAGR